MSFIKAKKHLAKYGLEDNVIEFKDSSKTVKEAANLLGAKEGEIAKTMSFLVGDKAVLIVTAGDKKIDNSIYKKEFKVKAKMIPKEDVKKLIGHDVGGVCPFGINDDVIVYLDVSLKECSVVYPACGSGNSAVKLTINELEEASNYKAWVDVCK